MNINITNCGDCIFRESDIDFDSVGDDTVDSCILLRKAYYENRSKDKIRNYTIAVYDSYEDKPIVELTEVLPDCPLIKDDLTIKLV